MNDRSNTKKHVDYPLKLYTDGGCIGKNPSPIGGTWAWVLTLNDEVITQDSGVLSAKSIGEGYSSVTNNQSELFAILSGLMNLSKDDVVEVCSDSNVSLGRVFRNSSNNNIPEWMVTVLKDQKKRIPNFKHFSYTLMDGHPTKEHLAAGVGKRGHPVSKWNKLCDDLCREAGQRYMENKNG